eukprot:1177947-Prorocentrum_minimum.AAC.3
MAEAILLQGGECRVYNDEMMQELLTFAEDEKRDRLLTLERDRLRAMNISTHTSVPVKSAKPKVAKDASQTRNIDKKGTIGRSETRKKKTDSVSQRQADAMTMRNKVRLKAYQDESARRDQEMKVCSPQFGSLHLNGHR